MPACKPAASPPRVASRRCSSGGSGIERHDCRGQSQQQKRARAADASVQSVFQFVPVRGRFTELIGDEQFRNRIGERHLLGTRDNCSPLALCRPVAPEQEVIKTRYLALDQAALDQLRHRLVQARPTCQDDTQGNRPIAVEAFEILKVAVEEWILVVSFDFERDAAFRIAVSDVKDVIDLV